jgi:serine/threonine protein kinase
LDWETRVKIALSTARGMDYLHFMGSGEKFIHGNIKSSNILLSQELGVCITEFGLAQLMFTPHVHPLHAKWLTFTLCVSSMNVYCFVSIFKLP